MSDSSIVNFASEPVSLRGPNPHAIELPFVSVIMPVRNEATSIERSVLSVLDQDYAPNAMELIVADGMSTDGTRAILEALSARDHRLRLISNPGLIMAKGFNEGFRESRGEIVLMMGGHAEMSPSYVSKCVEVLRNGVADCVGGVLATIPKDDRSEAIAIALRSRFGVGNASFRVGTDQPKFVDTVAFGAYRRDILERAGLLDEELIRNQDDELNYRLRKMGARILLAPEIHCRYYSRSSLRKLWRQYFLYGFWKVRVLQKHPRQMQLRQFAPVIFVLGLAIPGMGAFLSAKFAAAFTLICATYFALNFGASFYGALLARKKHLFPPLSGAFAAVHFAYGTGFFFGMLRFWNRWGD